MENILQIYGFIKNLKYKYNKGGSLFMLDIPNIFLIRVYFFYITMNIFIRKFVESVIKIIRIIISAVNYYNWLKIKMENKN